MQTTRTDRELVAAHLAGEAGAFEELARRHSAMLLGAARRLLGSGPDAEDAAQAAFMVLLRKARSLARGSGDLGAWLHRAAANVARTALRARRTRARHEKEAAAMRPAGQESSEARKLWREHARHLDAAIDSLPKHYQQALVLCYFEGLSQSQAAERLAVPESTVATRCSRGLEKLRGKLGVRERRPGASAIGALLLGRPAEAVPEGFIPSVVSAANGAAASAPILALTEGALKAMFWTKMKVVAATIAATTVIAVATPFAVKAASGESAGKDSSVTKKVIKKTVVKKPVPVNGLKLKLSLAPASLVCGEKCRKMLHLANGIKRCGCGQICNAGHKHCWNCAFTTGTCEVCGKKLPTGALDVKEFKVGVSHVKLLLTFENVSKEKMRVFTPLTHNLARSITIKVTGPGVVHQPPAIRRHIGGALPMLRNYPELSPGGKTGVKVDLAGNPPQIRGWDLYLTKPGVYKLTATYAYSRDKSFYFDPKPNPVPGPKIWKGTVKSQEIEIKVSGTIKVLPKGGPRAFRAR